MSATYFKTMGIPLLEGRVLEHTDAAASPPVIVLSRNTAERVFPGASAVGRRVAVDMGGDKPALFDVVGVVEDHQEEGRARESRGRASGGMS